MGFPVPREARTTEMRREDAVGSQVVCLGRAARHCVVCGVGTYDAIVPPTLPA